MTDRSTLRDLSAPPFATRHIGPSEAGRARMLEAVGYESVADLLAVAVPEAIRTRGPLNLPAAVGRPRPWPSCAPSPAATGC
ncbi:hypothetical protein GCM10027612_47230 [Microbispora bryophytorum subsp. camponoti]